MVDDMGAHDTPGLMKSVPIAQHIKSLVEQHDVIPEHIPVPLVRSPLGRFKTSGACAFIDRCGCAIFLLTIWLTKPMLSLSQVNRKLKITYIRSAKGANAILQYVYTGVAATGSSPHTHLLRVWCTDRGIFPNCRYGQGDSYGAATISIAACRRRR
jgi:hypothetical protein